MADGGSDKPGESRGALGPIATKVLYEDERVRIWDQLIEPGETTGPHHHALPYALVTVEGAPLDVIPVEGFPMMHGSETLSVDLPDRTASVLEAGSYEDARNTGDRPYRAILVEFKQAAQADA
ncbi:MAG: hypothetical protein CL931_13320 [Deltaproteobacteria bacterium]|nr:hypothetical protein [Deltaproteobacteria bacterium]